ncbi:MAG: type II toxin-antitoxin system MqsA family antitoxin [Clostridia bacterium]|nr:type II toxin-antitoxin system MqsA family antitoxin [Clostridia bacterium]
MPNSNYYCDNCAKEVRTIIKRVEKEFEVKDEKIIATITIRVCAGCGEEVWDEELERANEKIIYNLYRKKKGFLLPEDIKEIRSSIGISQTAFARLLGFGDKTIARYENGAPQDIAHDLLIRLMNVKKNVRIVFEQNKDALNEAECAKICEYLEREQDSWYIDSFLINYNSNLTGFMMSNLVYGTKNKKSSKKGENIWKAILC